MRHFLYACATAGALIAFMGQCEDMMQKKEPVKKDIRASDTFNAAHPE